MATKEELQAIIDSKTAEREAMYKDGSEYDTTYKQLEAAKERKAALLAEIKATGGQPTPEQLAERISLTKQIGTLGDAYDKMAAQTTYLLLDIEKAQKELDALNAAPAGTAGNSTVPDAAGSTTTTTVDKVQSAEATASSEDPMAAAVAANQATNEDTSPTEQNVIDASDDPALSAKAQAALEQQQAENRAVLAQEESAGSSSPANLNAKAGSNKPASATTYTAAPDWRLRISLSPKSTYLYNDSEPGILAPLKATKGVIFPYTPTVNVAYNATYDSQTITHSNFKSHNYQGSSVDQITVTGDFTAQDIQEANYMLAVIHFFRSATKMFYGKDTNPVRGTPPPLLYMSGFGQYQFDNHPMVLTGFTYNLPADVDYINAYPNRVEVGVNGAALSPYQPQSPGGSAGPIKSFINDALSRLTGSGLQKGGKSTGPVFSKPPTMTNEVTRVPTKINISLTFLPIVTRNAISNEFSLKDYASGKLLRGSQNPKAGGGIW